MVRFFVFAQEKMDYSFETPSGRGPQTLTNKKDTEINKRAQKGEGNVPLLQEQGPHRSQLRHSSSQSFHGWHHTLKGRKQKDIPTPDGRLCERNNNNKKKEHGFQKATLSFRSSRFVVSASTLRGTRRKQQAERGWRRECGDVI